MNDVVGARHLTNNHDCPTYQEGLVIQRSFSTESITVIDENRAPAPPTVGLAGETRDHRRKREEDSSDDIYFTGEEINVVRRVMSRLDCGAKVKHLTKKLHALTIPVEESQAE